MAKSDLEQSDLAGPVRTARREYAEWQPERSAWSAATRVDEFTFTPEGRFAECTFTRDDEGRVVKEESRFERGGPMARALDRPDMTAEARVELVEFLEVAFEDRLLSSMTFEYDSQGRLSESTRKFGTMGVKVSRFLYDDRGNVVERVETEHRRDVTRDAATGVTARGQESSRVFRIRFEHTLDDRGNWTERIVSNRLEPDGEFRRSNVERREITYWR